MAEQGGHFAHRGQSGGGLQTLLGGARQLFNAAFFAQVQDRTHPAGLNPGGIDQRRLDHQDWKDFAGFALEQGLKALACRTLGRHPLLLHLAVLSHPLIRPIRRWIQLGSELFGTEAHHFAKRRVHIGDVALQAACTQARDERILHGFAKRQGLGQLQLGTEPASGVAHQHDQHHDQRQRQDRDQGRQKVGHHVGRALPAVQAQHHGVAGQVQAFLGTEQTHATLRRAGGGQAGAIQFRQRQFFAAREFARRQIGQNVGQAVACDQVATDMAMFFERPTHGHHFCAKTVFLRHEVRGRIRRPARLPSQCASLRHVFQGFDLVLVVTQAAPKRGVHLGLAAQGFIAPFQAQNFTLLGQQHIGLVLPLGHTGVACHQSLQGPQIPGQVLAQVLVSRLDLGIHPALHLIGLQASRQINQGAQQSDDQHHQDHHQHPALHTGRAPINFLQASHPSQFLL